MSIHSGNENEDTAMGKESAANRSHSQGFNQDAVGFGDPSSKLLQIFKFLRSLNQLRNPVQRDINAQPWSLWLNKLPHHLTINRCLVANLAESKKSENNVNEDEQDYILKVRRPVLTDPPEPPKELKPWIKGNWRSIDAEITVQASKTGHDFNENRLIEEQFASDPERVPLFERWNNQRNKWAEEERPAREAMDVFEKLYELRARIGREGENYELMLGDGLLYWVSNGIKIYHPIHLQPIQINFDPDIPEFTIMDTDQPPELYTALLRSIPEINAMSMGRCRDEIERESWHPLGGENTSSFLRRLSTLISPRGQLVEYFSKKDEEPQIKREPVLFLRKRNLGFSSALERIIEELPDAETLPPSLVNIVGIEDSYDQEQKIDTGYTHKCEEDKDIFLTKPANKEQLAIARKLENQGAVLVQGPPGTGKTHTIGNLIGHLLAQGKSILVTSHTNKALQVVHKHVDTQLQSLCVSVLDDSIKQMEKSVETIVERLSTSNYETLIEEAEQHKLQRVKIIDELRSTRETLKSALRNEYRAIVYAGQEYGPAEAARMLAEQREEHSWIPSPVALGEPLPLTESELIDLYNTNGQVTAADELDLQFELPVPNDLPSPSDFKLIVTRLDQLLELDLDINKELWAETSKDNSEELKALLDDINGASSFLNDETDWRLDAIASGKEGGARRSAWEDFLEEIESACRQSTENRSILLRYRPSVENDNPFLEQVTTDIINHFENGGSIKSIKFLVKSSWRDLLRKSLVNSKQPQNQEHFEAILAYLKILKSRDSLSRWWDTLIASQGGVSFVQLGDEPELVCRQMVPNINSCLRWFDDTWEVLKERLLQQGFIWDLFIQEVPPSLSSFGEVKRMRVALSDYLPEIISTEINRRLLADHQNQLVNLNRQLDDSPMLSTEALVVQKLMDSVNNRDIVYYTEAYERLKELHHKSNILSLRSTLLSKLEKVAPTWASALRNREGIHGQNNLPGNPLEAWRWRQLNDELKRRASVSIEEIQLKIEQQNDNLKAITSSLVGKLAWAYQVKKTSQAQRQALMGWKQLTRKIGRGTGRRVPRLRAEAKKLMPICQTTVPVWVMPLNRVVDNFDPSINRFDVVIIDEASQSDLMALIAIYMGKQVIVVGDHEQVSPLSVGLTVDDIHNLIDEHLEGIPNKELYDGKFSIYDLAQTSYEPICLREHFRCIEPIIQFCNHLSYGGKIIPLRDSSDVERKPYIMAYRVEGSSLNHTNEEEALVIASLLAASIEQPEYDDATYGVISMIGDDQARLVELLLRRHLSPSDFVNRNILCGNSAQFQGDERDIVFLSMVDSPKGDGPLNLRREGPDNMFKKRFNVAVSRARDQLWIIHSLDPYIDLKQGDIRRQLILHAKDPESIINIIKVQEKKTESEFERQVLRRLLQAGYHVTPQWPVGAFRIDMVVEGEGLRLAIECDGDRYHPLEKIGEDMERQAILERLGWKFFRIRGSEYFLDPEESMGKVFKRLGSMGIFPAGPKESDISEANQNELFQRIQIRAAELRREWTGEEGNKYRLAVDENVLEDDNSGGMGKEGQFKKEKNGNELSKNLQNKAQKPIVLQKGESVEMGRNGKLSTESIKKSKPNEGDTEPNPSLQGKQLGFEGPISETSSHTSIELGEGGLKYKMQDKISYEEFFKKAILKLRNPQKSKGIHSVYSGFNDAFRRYYDEDPIVVTQKLAKQGAIEIQPRKGGVMIYLPDEAPKGTGKSAEETLNKILEEDE